MFLYIKRMMGERDKERRKKERKKREKRQKK
jgi:hypothetical protein